MRKVTLNAGGFDITISITPHGTNGAATSAASTRKPCRCRYIDRKLMQQIAFERGYVAKRAGRYALKGEGSIGELAKKMSFYGPSFRSADTQIYFDTNGEKIVAPERLKYIAKQLSLRTGKEYSVTDISKPFRKPHKRCYMAIRKYGQGKVLRALEEVGKEASV